MKKPNVFLIGASKAGTTSLANALGEHSSIFMADPKEPNFFNKFDTSDEVDTENLERYLTLFEGAESQQVVGEASVSYLSSTKSAQHIYNFNPDAKILISLRNPVERIRSLYEMYVRHGLSQSFDFAVKEDPWLLRQCYYYDPVKRFVEIFPRNQIAFIEFSQIVADWDATIDRIFDFLAVSPIEMEKPVVRNVGGLPKHPSIKFLKNRKIVELGKAVIPKQYHALVDKGIKGAAFDKMTLSEDQKSDLSRLFLEDVTKLDKLLKTDYSSKWLRSSDLYRRFVAES